MFCAAPTPIVTVRLLTTPPLPICTRLFVAWPVTALPITSAPPFRFQVLTAGPPAMLSKLLLALLPAVALPITLSPVAAVLRLPPLVITTLSPLSLLATVSDPTFCKTAPPATPLPSMINRL